MRTCHLSTPLSSVSVVDSCYLSHNLSGFWGLNKPSTVVCYFGLPGTRSLRLSIPKHCILFFPNPKTLKCRNATSQYFSFRNSGVSQCKGPWLLVLRIFGIPNPEVQKSQNSSLNNSLRNSRVRVTKDFWLTLQTYKLRFVKIILMTPLS
jgi:hypothetical protein